MIFVFLSGLSMLSLLKNDMRSHLKKLLSDFPNVDIAAMGFPKNWEEEPLWCSAPQE